MQHYEELYHRLLKASVEHELPQEVERIEKEGEPDGEELNALLHPERYPVVIGIGDDCTCTASEPDDCALGCLFSAIRRDDSGKIRVSEDCVGCEKCLFAKKGTLVERHDFVPLFHLLSDRESPVYAMIAPAFLGQFGSGITSGKLRAAFKKIGFYGMIEVALFADVLTLKEALEYNRLVQTDRDFLLTSCCCPLWVNFIRKNYGVLTPHIPPSVSPMVACARAIKRIHPEAKTVFIGPCLAKKAEAKEEDIRDAVDIVLTFSEMRDIFEAACVEPNAQEEDVKDHSSKAGRIYARTGGVSEAVEQTLHKLVGKRSVPFRAQQIDGIANFKSLLADVASGNVRANFLEGMGCVGGCVGGPRVMIDKEKGRENVNAYGDQAAFETPVDNPYIFAMLSRLGFETVGDLLKHDHNMFIREWET